MRRRAPDLRRPARRKISNWIWLLIGFFVFAGLILFVVHHQHHDRLDPPIQETTSTLTEDSHKTLNFTEELLSTTSFARQLADQMALAKAYVIIAKEKSNLQLAWELSTQIRNCQRLLSQAAVRGKAITLEEAQPIITKLSHLIYKAQDSHYDISTTITTLKNHVQALEERAHAATAQGIEYAKLASESVPKSLHCLNIKLNEAWFKNPSLTEASEEQKNSPKLVDNNLYHFCIFSDNVLATSVVINSTISNAEHPKLLVFHIVTDEVNYLPMLTWFLMNDFNGCTVNVRSLKEFSWLNKEADAATLLNHLRFYLPQMHPSIEKVVFLEDDIVVQKDLIPLFSLDLHGNVNGAVETCLEGYHRFYRYLNFSDTRISSKYDPQACGWAFGLNVFDLIAWKRENITSKYNHWQMENVDSVLWKGGTLPIGFLTFYGLVEPLDRRWHVLGLGYDVDIDDRLTESAAVVHYNGNMKPWLKLAISRYKHLWDKYVNFLHPFLKDCLLR